MAGAASVAATVNPHEDGTALTVADTWCPDVQHQAALLVHRLRHKLVAEAIVRLAVALVPRQALVLRSLRPVDFALADALELVRSLWRHEPLGLGILNALEGEDTAVLIALDGAIDGLYAGVLSCRDRLCLND